MNRIILGQRVFPNKFGDLRLPFGVYGQDMAGRWWARPPGANTVDLKYHVVEEQVDGGVTVMPVINSGNGVGVFTLRGGVWNCVTNPGS